MTSEDWVDFKNASQCCICSDHFENTKNEKIILNLKLKIMIIEQGNIEELRMHVVILIIFVIDIYPSYSTT